MKIFTTNNYCTNSRKIALKGGLTKNIHSEMLAVDCKKIENFLQKEKNIQADFADNKIVAWSVCKVVDLISQINKKYSVGIHFPQNIFIEDLTKFTNIPTKGILGFTNYFPCRFYKDNDNLVPGMSIIFNKNFQWNNLDEHCDYTYIINSSPTNHFLEPFFHEFAHIFHEANLLQKLTSDKLIKYFQDVLNVKTIKNFRENFGSNIGKILCEYATESPLELVACDLSKRFISELTDNVSALKKNPLNFYPYKNTKKSLSNQQNSIDILINKIFNGDVKL